MPDVKMFMHASLCHAELLHDEVPKIVAEQMSCRLPYGPGDFYRIDPDKEIDLILIRDNEAVHPPEGPYDVSILSHTSVLMEVAAYDFPDRMSSMPERLTEIATRVKDLLTGERDPEVTVSITFIPIEQGHWIAV